MYAVMHVALILYYGCRILNLFYCMTCEVVKPLTGNTLFFFVPQIRIKSSLILSLQSHVYHSERVYQLTAGYLFSIVGLGIAIKKTHFYSVKSNN